MFSFADKTAQNDVTMQLAAKFKWTLHHILHVILTDILQSKTGNKIKNVSIVLWEYVFAQALIK